MPKIRFNDAFDENFKKELQEVSREMESLLSTFKELGKEARIIQSAIKSADSFDEMSKAAKSAADNVDRLTDEEKELKRIVDATQKATVKYTTALSDENIALQKAKEQQRRATAEARKLAKAQLEGAKSTNKWGVAVGSFAFKFNALGNIAANVVQRLVSGFTQMIRGSVQAFDTQIKAERQLLQALNNRVDIQRDLIKQAQDLQKVTLFGDEETIRAQALLAAFVKEEAAIKRIIPLVQDFAAAKGVDLATASDLVAKTLGSSTNALSRYGIAVEGVVGSTERLESLARGLTDAFGGQAKVAAEADAIFTQLKNTYGDLQEAVGRYLSAQSSAGGALAQSLNRELAQLAELLGKRAINENLEKASDLFVEFGDSVKELSKADQEIAFNVKIEQLTAALEQQRGIYRDIEKEAETAGRKRRKELEEQLKARFNDIEVTFEYLELLKNVTFEEEKRLAVFEDVSAQIKALKEDEAKGLEEYDQDYVSAYSAAWDQIEVATEGAIGNLESMLAKADQDRLDALDERVEAEKRAANERIATERAVQNSLIDIAYESFNIASGLTQRRIDQLDKQAEDGIISEKKYQTEVNKLRRREDAVAKAQALFQIAVNTAIAATKVASQTGVGAAIAVPLVIGLGAVQAAAVLSEPMPQYELGTDAALGGPALVSEKGQELVKERSGKLWLTPDKPTIMDIPKGARVTPADVTHQMLKYATIATGLGPSAKDDTILRLMNEMEEIKHAIKSKPVMGNTITPAGIMTATQRGNTTSKKIKRYFM